MTSHLEKEIARLSKKDRERFIKVWQQVLSLEWKGLDIKKLSGAKSIFRVRIGKNRIVFTLHEDGSLTLEKVAKRNERTY